jgi:carbonic anhydrase
LDYSLTNTGVKASYPSEDICERPQVEIPGIPGVYEALQFHIHTSSEHTIDGKFFGAELHTVHGEIGGGRYAVVGMMIHPNADENNELFDALLDGWQTKYDANVDSCVGFESGSETETAPDSIPIVPDAGDRKLLKEQRDLQQPPQAFSPYLLIPEGSTFYHYDGGLTTPPCSEVVWWNLADKAVSITPGQYSRLSEYVLGFTDPSTCHSGTNAGSAGSTSRPIQPLNGRTVERICPVNFKKDSTC